MADLGTLLRAAPIGLFMLFGSYWAARRRKGEAARAVSEMPELAARLGLEFLRPSAPGRIGAVRGHFRGFDVYVDPDERPRIVVYFQNAPPLVLRSFEHEKRTPNGMRRFETTSPAADALFKERFASEDAISRLSSRAGELEAAVRTLRGASDKIAHVSATSERLECAFEYARPNHLPVQVVEAALPALAAMARTMDPGAAEAPS